MTPEKKWKDKGTGTLTLRRATGDEGAGKRPYFVFTTDSGKWVGGQAGGWQEVLGWSFRLLLDKGGIGNSQKQLGASHDLLCRLMRQPAQHHHLPPCHPAALPLCSPSACANPLLSCPCPALQAAC